MQTPTAEEIRKLERASARRAKAAILSRIEQAETLLRAAAREAAAFNHWDRQPGQIKDTADGVSSLRALITDSPASE